MPSNGDPVEDHMNGIRYGGKILSLIPAPEGWFVGTQVKRRNRKTRETDDETPQVRPLIAWALVDAMFRDGHRETRILPAFLGDSGNITHASEYRWMEGAGDVDPDGWSTLVAVEVLPPPDVLANAPRYEGRRWPTAGPDSDPAPPAI
ncbi:hypothetical protein ACIF80_09590 [Streptomyces sp. NPDC085927]|uniref:hypothetical protein n=1 Tax=Streptomyces sp. NPDC085927 TaxID=3365738 RepID=UPI0037D4C13B